MMLYTKVQVPSVRFVTVFVAKVVVVVVVVVRFFNEDCGKHIVDNINTQYKSPFVCS